MQTMKPYSGEKPYIFVAYSHKNAVEAAQIIGPLQEEGYRIWFDQGIAPGRKYNEVIARKILDCSLFMPLLSGSFYQSDYCMDEIIFARDNGKTIIPIFLEDTPVPPELRMRLGRLEAIERFAFDREELFRRRVHETAELQACRDEGTSREFTGRGVYTSPEGLHYDGDWLNGNYHGDGIMSWPDGSRYEGQWKNSRFHGNGLFHLKDKWDYKGTWVDGRRSGIGTVSWPDGRQYSGQWKDGMRHGSGVMTWPDGRKFTGNWENGQRSGEGEMEHPSGLRWSGHWKEGILNSEVTARWPDGRQYTGQWENAKPSGEGIMLYPDGHRYGGQWKNGKPNGPGMEILSGYVSKGSFVNGKKEGVFTEYALSDPEKKQTVRYSNGYRV